MKPDDITIYQYVAVSIKHKCQHIHKIGGKVHRDFTKDIGDVPIARFNPDTNLWEAVVNNRGRAYAARKRMKYRELKHG